MPQGEKLSIAVPQELADMMRHAVEAGEYASTGEVVREALREWELRRLGLETARTQLGRLWDEGLASGPAVDGEEAFGRIRSKLASERRTS